MAQTRTSTTFVSQTAPQAHPIFLLRPVRYSTPNYPHATVIRPILSSNINPSVTRPPLIRRLIRPGPPPFIPTNQNIPVSVQRNTPSRETSPESALSTLSTLSSIYEEESLPRKRQFCSCLPCCRSHEQQTLRSSSRINDHPISNNSNFPCKRRTIYILTILLFVFFLIVIILLIVLIAVRR